MDSHVLYDEQPRAATGPPYSSQGLTDMLELYSCTRGPSEYPRPFAFYIGPSSDEYARHDIGYHKQSFHMPQQNFSLPPTDPQGRGTTPHAHRKVHLLAPRRSERFNARYGVPRANINASKNPNPWARGRHNEARPPVPLDPRVNGLPPIVINIVREEIDRAF